MKTIKNIAKDQRSLRTNEILAIINSNGGFDNFNHWNRKEVAQYIRANYNCSAYVAKNVAFYLAN